jgi:hypothetical protein
MDKIKFVNVAVISETSEISKLGRGIFISMLVFTYSEVGTGQKVTKLKLKICKGSITVVRS